MRSVASSPTFYVSSAVDSHTSGFHVLLREPPPHTRRERTNSASSPPQRLTCGLADTPPAKMPGEGGLTATRISQKGRRQRWLMRYESPRQSGRSRTATTSSGRTYVAVASPSREDDTRPAGHIEKPSTIRGKAQHGGQRTLSDFTATSPPTTFSPAADNSPLSSTSAPAEQEIPPATPSSRGLTWTLSAGWHTAAPSTSTMRLGREAADRPSGKPSSPS